MHKIIKSREDLLKLEVPREYHFFWGHKSSAVEIDSSCLSQWFHSPFEVNGVQYVTAEHFMMAAKARMFGDREALERILYTMDPGQAKSIGREVKGFKEDEWELESFWVVAAGNFHKFNTHPKLREYLLSTHPKVLVEASPFDQIWGIGLKAMDPRAQNPETWRGENRLGFALMYARSMLQVADSPAVIKPFGTRKNGVIQ